MGATATCQVTGSAARRYRRHMKSRIMFGMALLLVVGGCGGETATTEPPATAGATTTVDETGDDACPSAPFTGELSRVAADGHTDVARLGPDMVDTLAVARVPGSAYTIYLADYEIDRAELGETLVAPEGQVLVTFAIDQGEGIVVGERTATDGSGSVPFVIIDSGGGASDSAQGYNDHYRIVTGLSGNRICFEIRYHDDVKMVIGEVSSPIELSF
jgi:hypothetical protein